MKKKVFFMITQSKGNTIALNRRIVDMQYQSIEEQNRKLIEIISRNKDFMTILDYVASLNLPNFYIAAGSIFQTVWNDYDNKPLNYGIKDFDIIYYDSNDIRIEKDLAYYNKIRNFIKSKNMEYEIDVSNEARMHLWKKEKDNQEIEPYQSSEDAISRWIATVHAIGITKRDGNIQVYAPYGLSDIFSRTIRPIKHNGNSKELYQKKVASWSNRFEQIHVIEWE